jgi:hypothetical protein
MIERVGNVDGTVVGVSVRVVEGRFDGGEDCGAVEVSVTFGGVRVGDLVGRRTEIEMSGADVLVGTDVAASDEVSCS